ncbi:MAG: hypothetical protein N3E45_08065 [Oscillatoriaceae bacterium SKW80]|nr:hypothetical protein [Oscillatoriaceae bacterium SKYG93]MCX8120773.1 hypothetical protein [Oscillatoriaceae bacterium SKW80]MDW8451852.1 hypothetical protein [Oscillatoriaceae cyanobacterium SKYGB_i_bin93]HIK28563.1 hypothetical protein [Oscillatoriaceae cyanobacterium M7585_C2015_266]
MRNNYYTDFPGRGRRIFETEPTSGAENRPSRVGFSPLTGDRNWRMIELKANKPLRQK